MRHYLLEKSRVTKRSQNELNFHIFYQLYAGLRNEGRLNEYDLVRPSAHAYLQGVGAPSDGEVRCKGPAPRAVTQHCCSSRPKTYPPPRQILGSNYSNDWQESIQGLQMMGFESNDIQSITAVLAAILHIGDITFEEAANVRGGKGGEKGLHSLSGSALGCRPGWRSTPFVGRLALPALASSARYLRPHGPMSPPSCFHRRRRRILSTSRAPLTGCAPSRASCVSASTS